MTAGQCSDEYLPQGVSKSSFTVPPVSNDLCISVLHVSELVLLLDAANCDLTASIPLKVTDGLRAPDVN